jgi:hypothetical protein
MKLYNFLILFNFGIGDALKMNLKNIMTSHLINQSFKKHIHSEIINSSDIMKHLEDKHLDTFYVFVLSSSFIYTFSNLEISAKKNYYVHKRFEFLFLTLLFVLCKNVENAT